MGTGTEVNRNLSAKLAVYAVVSIFSVILLPTIFPAGALAAEGWSTPTNIEGGAANDGNELDSVSCPSESFCAAVDRVGNAFTYHGGAWSGPRSIAAGWPLAAVSCSSLTFCVAAEKNKGEVLTYNGSSWSTPVWVMSGAPQSVSCPIASFCVVSAYGHVAIYNDSVWTRSGCIDCAPTAGPNRVYAYTLTSVSCPSASFCATVDGWGKALTYDGSSWSAPVNVDGETRLTSVSCATTSFCVAVDQKGKALIYSGTSWSASVSVDPDSQLNAVSCPSTMFCVAVDGSGRALIYDGSTWGAPSTIDPGHALSSVSCPSTLFCITVDYVGNAFTYHASIPSNTSPPTISGRTTQGQTLGEQSGSWTGNPISYSYQWEDCDGSGSNCHSISGATAPSYTLSAEDVGDTIRVQESARSLAGTSGPAVSSATSVVQGFQSAAGRVRIGHAKTHGMTARVPIGCTGPIDVSCKVDLAMVLGDKVGRHDATENRVSTRRTVAVGEKTVTLTADQRRNVRIKLNPVGRRFAVVHRTLSVRLRVTQAANGRNRVVSRQRVVFRLLGRRGM